MNRYYNYRSVQRGAGIGSILGKMFRFATPLLKAGFRVAKPHLMAAGKRTIRDVMSGEPIKDTLVREAKRTAKDVVSQATGDIFGSSFKQTSPTKGPQRRKRRRQTGAGSVHMKRRKHTQHITKNGFDPFN